MNSSFNKKEDLRPNIYFQPSRQLAIEMDLDNGKKWLSSVFRWFKGQCHRLMKPHLARQIECLKAPHFLGSVWITTSWSD